MINMMLNFSEALRLSGVTVSISAVHNAVESLRWIDKLNKKQMYAALESCFVANSLERSTFQTVFERFFIQGEPVELFGRTKNFQDHVSKFAKLLNEQDELTAELLADFIKGKPKALLEELDIKPVDPGYYYGSEEEDSKDQLAKRESLKKKIRITLELAEDFSARSFQMSREQRVRLEQFLRDRLMEAWNLVEKKPAKKMRDPLLPWEKKKTVSSISFAQLTQQEVETVKTEVEALAHKFKDILSQRKKNAKKGHIEIKNTLRRSMKFEGIPFKICRKQPSRKKGKIFALCDVSSSVSYAAQFMLLLLYRLQNRFSKIRSFVFIREMFEISTFFEGYPLESAMQRAIKTHKIGMGQPSNYGNSFRSFLHQFGNSLNKDTTVIIMGDGQNNFNDPLVDTIEEIKEKSARIYWLNPELEKHWYSASNAMPHYIPHCKQVVECATLDQLADFTRNLIL